ncbi:hypothetical protein NLI96_g5066 [Meripilus lineatus]|uniref:J domain-containing protein n=1 Tax=Meripilus lineatus TaxID=2056292 RepID=A0AAD5V413_9APHY|nr:hypothetical protein NLI96_g5066 [Physisporinus lineatus]
MYHPDITSDPKAKEKFQAVSEAYSILGDDRKRRAYDKTLGELPEFNSRTQRYGAVYETRRQRGATHAWEYSRPPPNAHRPSANHSYTYTHTQRTYPQPSSDPFASPYVQNATGKKAPPPHHHRMRHGYHSEADQANRVSSLWRAAQVFGVVLLVATVGGGFGASAA